MLPRCALRASARAVTARSRAAALPLIPLPFTPEPIPPTPFSYTRLASSASSKRWQTRQGKDKFSREARVQGLMSRAAFKLLEMNEKYKVFKKGQTVVDLGYAPGSWSQVAADRTSPGGRVIGIDVIPAQPPKGVSTIQGNFLSPAVRADVVRFVRDPLKGRLREQRYLHPGDGEGEDASSMTMEDLEAAAHHYLEDSASALENDGKDENAAEALSPEEEEKAEKRAREAKERVVDVLLSDMCEPWEQTTGFHKRSLSDPYRRMMNTSGMAFRDHAGSMDLCNAALIFAFDTLRPGGSFICKFYQGAEDKNLEKRLRALFSKVHREKPDSSRSESKEAYFVALRRKPDVARETVLDGI